MNWNHIESIIHHHWLDLILLPANILAIDVIIKGAAEKHDFKKISQICDWVSNVVGFIQDIVVGLISRKQQPPTNTGNPGNNGGTMKAAILIAALLICGVAQAQEVSIGDTLKKLPGLKQGVAYSLIDNKINYLTTIDVAKWKDLNLEVGYAGAAENTGNKLVAVLSYNIFNAKKAGITWPVADLIDLRLGVYGGVGRIEVGDNPTMHGNNEWDAGASLTAITVKF